MAAFATPTPGKRAPSPAQARVGLLESNLTTTDGSRATSAAAAQAGLPVVRHNLDSKAVVVGVYFRGIARDRAAGGGASEVGPPPAALPEFHGAWASRAHTRALQFT